MPELQNNQLEQQYAESHLEYAQIIKIMIKTPIFLLGMNCCFFFFFGGGGGGGGGGGCQKKAFPGVSTPQNSRSGAF